VCSGIEAATVAWHPLGWEPAAFAEIEKFPAAVLQHHYPAVANLGDMTKYKEWNIGNIDLLVGGTPCQSFSVAGLRKGLDDPRGNLALVYLGIAERFRPRWILWENVPGVLSSYSGPEPPSDLEEGQEWEAEETSDFECFTAALGQLGYGFAYRILDAQYFGVPQRRRRVFVVGYLGDWRRTASVLFERHSLSGNSPPRREAGKGIAGNVARSLTRRYDSSEDGTGRGLELIPTTFAYQSLGDYRSSSSSLKATGSDLGKGCESLICMAHGQGGAEIVRDGSPSLTCNHEAPICAIGIDEECNATEEGFGPLVRGGQGGTHQAVCIHGTQDPCVSDIAFAQGRNNGGENVVCQVQWASGGGKLENDTAQALRAGAEHNYQFVRNNMQVRRLTPIECERLQGFSDNYTRIPWRGKPEEQCPYGPRYKALGNSMAVPVMRWIGDRISVVDKIVTPLTK